MHSCNEIPKQNSKEKKRIFITYSLKFAKHFKDTGNKYIDIVLENKNVLFLQDM